MRDTENGTKRSRLFISVHTHTHAHTREVMIGLMGNANEITTGGCVLSVCECVCVCAYGFLQNPSITSEEDGRTRENIHHTAGQYIYIYNVDANRNIYTCPLMIPSQYTDTEREKKIP